MSSCIMDVKQFASDKILAHIDRITEWLKKGISRPITYELSMTNICNNRCPYCFGFYERANKKDSLKKGEAKDIIYQIKRFGGKGLTFTGGGEPLCNPYTINAVKYARRIGLDTGFITNGLLINEKIAKSLLKNCTWLRISLDAATKEMFKLTHGLDGKAFEKVINNIRLLVKIKKALDSKCTIGVGFLTSPETKKEIYRFVLLCRDLKVDYAQFRPLLRVYKGKEIDYSDGDQREIIYEIKKATALSENGYRVLYSQHKYNSMLKKDNLRMYKKCYGHHFATVIGPDKKMYVCCHFAGVEKYCIGNLSKMSLKDIWRSAERNKIYESIDLVDCIPLCRCNTFNTVLWDIKQKKVHPNFI